MPADLVAHVLEPFHSLELEELVGNRAERVLDQGVGV